MRNFIVAALLTFVAARKVSTDATPDTTGFWFETYQTSDVYTWLSHYITGNTTVQTLDGPSTTSEEAEAAFLSLTQTLNFTSTSSTESTTTQQLNVTSTSSTESTTTQQLNVTSTSSTEATGLLPLNYTSTTSTELRSSSDPWTTTDLFNLSSSTTTTQSLNSTEAVVN